MLATQRRRHFTQMSAQERLFLRDELDKLRPEMLDGLDHFFYRQGRRGFSEAEVNETIKSGSVVEANNIRPEDLRVLLRKDYPTHSVCVVVSLLTKRIITIYKNDTDDNHSTLNRSNYLLTADIRYLFNHLNQRSR